MEVPCIIGAGYVGLTYAAGLALKGFKVNLVDVNAKIIEKINSGICPIDEPKLPDVIKDAARKKTIRATTSLMDVFEESDIFIVCVGTYCDAKGNIDLSHVKSVAKDLKECFEAKPDVGYKVICIKSTVLCGTTDGVFQPILESSGKVAGRDFGLAMSPEFLKEGSALDDILNPDKLVIGGLDARSIDKVRKLLGVFVPDDMPERIIETSLRTAELIKYAQNSFLATKISFINEISNFAELFGVDVGDVASAIGLDRRISPYFLNAGPGFGGSCFPKDVRALYTAGRKMGYSPLLLEAVLQVNSRQKNHVVELLGWNKEIPGSIICILGLSFKANTGDTRESVAKTVIPRLLHLGAREVHLHDPSSHAREELKREFVPDEKIHYHEEISRALENADVCLILTDWEHYKNLKPSDFEIMNENAVIIDARRILSRRLFENSRIKLTTLGFSTNKDFVPS
ncbi:MAG: UDP-glucose dehydrogenase family protein [Promethearchaeota archaeon]